MDANQALAERFEEHRVPLRAVAYRLLGSLNEAEDAVQEAWLRGGMPASASTAPSRGLGAATASDRTPLGLLGTSPRTHRWASVGCAARDSNPEPLPKRAGGPIADLRPLVGIGPDLGVWLPLLSAGGQGLPIVRGPSAAHGQRNAGMLLRYCPLVSPLVELS